MFNALLQDTMALYHMEFEFRVLLGKVFCEIVQLQEALMGFILCSCVTEGEERKGAVVINTQTSWFSLLII